VSIEATQSIGRRPRLRILQMVSAATTSGPSVYVLALSQQLRELGHDVSIVARPHSWVAE
jgi:hypothetical protein